MYGGLYKDRDIRLLGGWMQDRGENVGREIAQRKEPLASVGY